LKQIAIAAVCALCSSAWSADAGWLAGAARADLTPPPADANAFAICAGAFGGPTPFAFEEPYLDNNGNGVFDYGPDLWCDANANGRWDGIFISGGVDHQAQNVHDPIDVRALAVSDGGKTMVLESVAAQGLFIHVIDRIRDRARELRPGITDVIVSANHNESSPDTIGIYGAPSVMDAFGARSGIDDYYIAFLVEQCAQAAAQAFDAMQPATLWAHTFPTPANLVIDLSNNFPTTDDDDQPAAIDPKVRVLQARDAQGTAIFTLMNLAAHNQEIGHSGNYPADLSSDWPGFFHAALESQVPGLAIYLVGDNGSEEDPATVPPISTDSHPECEDGCYAQAQATGEGFASAVAAKLDALEPLAFGPIIYDRAEFFVPIENNLFKAAARAGIFGDRPTYIAGIEIPLGQGVDLKTTVAVLDLGPDFQLIANPGEAFPALMIGGPWGIEDAGCPTQDTPLDPARDNPPVPTWRAHARFRFQAGLANDMIGYLIPAWAFSSEQGTYLTTCSNDSDNRDPAGHKHKLEDEGLGPTASNLVALELAGLLDQRRDPAAVITRGRYVAADGTLSRKAASAVAVTLESGDVVALGEVTSFGEHAVSHGEFMDYDGAAQGAPDISTRGMLVRDASGAVIKRYYLDLYPTLAAEPLPPAQISTAPNAGGGGSTGPDAPVRYGGGLPPGLLLALGACAVLRRRRRCSAVHG
jgi:hypothetical protein